MTKKCFLTASLLSLGMASAVAQLNSSVSVEGEYQPLVIETERLSTFPRGYRFELPPANLDYEYTGLVTDFRPSLLTMGATGRMTDWPWQKRHGFIDARLGSFLNSRVHAGAFLLDTRENTLYADARFRSTSFSSDCKLYEGSLGLRYDGFFGEAHCLRADVQGDYLAYDRGPREWNLSAGAGYDYRLNSLNSLGIDLQGDFLFPRGDVRNYGNVALTPAYRFANGRFSLKAGVKADISYDATGKLPGEKFGTLHVAPDVSLQYRVTDAVGVFASATGAVTPSTIGFAWDTDPFWTPWQYSPRPVYSPVDARGGVEIGPFYGFSLSASVRYAAARNVPLEAWSGLPDSRGARLHGFGFGGRVSYSYGSVVAVNLEGTYTPQHGTRGIFNGFDRPRWVLDASVSARPIRKLGIEAGYDYRGVRNCYGRDASGNLEATRLPDITGLHARVGYFILDNLELYCKGENLLNRRVELLPGLDSRGIAVSGGVYLEF